MTGTIYPSGIDGPTQLPLVVDGVSPVRAGDVNRIRNAIIAAEKELGINPSGTFSTIRSRLDTLEVLTGGDGYLNAESVLIDDSAGFYTGGNVEAALTEIGTSLANITATEISIADTDGYYISTDVEGALTEIGQDLSNLVIDFISGHIETPENKEYFLGINLPYAGSVNSITTKADSGTADGYATINGIPLGGGSNSISSSEITVNHVSANTFVVGDDLSFVIENNVVADDMRFMLRFTRML